MLSLEYYIYYYIETSDMNDAISILALAVSIATTGLSIKISNIYYRLIIKLTSKSK